MLEPRLFCPSINLLVPALYRMIGFMLSIMTIFVVCLETKSLLFILVLMMLTRLLFLQRNWPLSVNVFMLRKMKMIGAWIFKKKKILRVLLIACKVDLY